MIVTIGATKGGVGKSTLSINIACALAVAGRDVWLVDGDRQGTSQTAITIRTDAGQLPGIAVAQYADGQTLRGQIQHQRSKHDVIIIDAGGRDSTALRAALVLSDVLLVPFQPRSLDVWSLEQTAALVDEARSVRDGLRAYAVLNLADPGSTSTDNADAAAAIADWPALEYLDTPIVRRKAFANAAGQGVSVHELNPKDAKACSELDALIARLF
ncbi:Cobyrinic acid ac-diamide synthase [Pseudomonas syringae pv. actinidiae ICMP 19099]|uniref:AAA family ATPase n=1 Tax=Pseudomonas syringae TaxID=317 RepID=UPI0003576796|nr:AAA family ATPase [Pseudomonas syringae]EPN22710.1 Cobyrinic acid ac-diamide synthase [Pseudomonas syringae pv. actinidiae ICMP 19099]